MQCRSGGPIIAEYKLELEIYKEATDLRRQVMDFAEDMIFIEQIDFAWGGETLRFFDRISPLGGALGRIRAVVTVPTKIAEIRKVGDDLSTFPSGAARFTARERQMLQLLAQGTTSAKAASTLEISRKTFETHRTRIMQKLDLHKTSALVSYTARLGLL